MQRLATVKRIQISPKGEPAETIATLVVEFKPTEEDMAELTRLAGGVVRITIERPQLTFGDTQGR